MTTQARIKQVDHLQQTLPMGNTPKIRELFEKIEGDLKELGFCLFPFDEDMAGELAREGCRCEVQ